MKRAKRFIVTFVVLLCATTVFAAAPVQVSYINETTGVAVPVSTVHPMPVVGSFVVTGSATEETLAQILAEMTDPDTRAWILNWPSSYPVTGAFYQATQPISGTVTAAQATLGALKTAATLYTTDGQIMDITHPVYTSPATGAVTPAMADVTSVDTVFDVTMTDTSSTFNTGALPAKCIAYELSTSGGTAFTWAWSSGGITSNYYKQAAGIPLTSFQLGANMLFTGTIYFKGTTATDVMCVHLISKP